MVISVILGHEKTKIQNILDLGESDVFSVRTNIYIKNKSLPVVVHWAKNVLQLL